MSRFRHTVFVCTHRRDPEAQDPRGDCTQRGSAKLVATLKARSKEPAWRGQVRIVASGCLDLCRKGCAAVVFSDPAHGPAETWYTGLGGDDGEGLFDRHIVQQRQWPGDD